MPLFYEDSGFILSDNQTTLLFWLLLPFVLDAWPQTLAYLGFG